MSPYAAPFPFWNGHLQTLYPTLFRKVAEVTYRRERIDTPDGDFLDLDWSKVGSREIVVVSHGLEGHSERAYVRGMVRAMNRAGFDAVAWNFRSCSGEGNRTLRLYHSGATDDLDTVVRHALSRGYDRVHLVGFSMGGNLGLLYLGRDRALVPEEVSSCVAFSVPCDLTDASKALARPSARFYMRRFLRLLKEKIEVKHAQFPERISLEGYDEMTDFKAFDDRYTAPLHGFESAEDYWRKSSSRAHLHRIAVPTLLVNALDDPFLKGGCYPYEECERNPHVTLETPKRGGHVGFVTRRRSKVYWSEERAVTFVRASRSAPLSSPAGPSRCAG